MRLRATFPLLLAAGVALAGCWYHVEQYCPSCPTVDHKQSAVPPTAPATKTEVLLVHGSFGFGPEWTPVVDAVRAAPGFDLVAWKWPGPFKDPKGDALALRAEIQALLDGLPPEVSEIIVLAHSAGGLLANLAIRGLDVHEGRHVTAALLDPAFWPAVGKHEQYTPIPKGVSARVFFAQEAPTKAKNADPPSGVAGTDLPWEYVGKIGHDPMVARSALPILDARRTAMEAERLGPDAGAP